MTDKKTVVANHGVKPSSGPKAKRVSDEKRFISDERRVQDALEDDEVRFASLSRARGLRRWGCRPGRTYGREAVR